MAGRRPKPSHLKVVEGTAARHPTPPHEPKPPRLISPAPKRLPADVAAAWDGLATILDKMGVLTEADVHALERLAELHVDIIALTDTIRAEGRVYETVTETGSTIFRPRPEVAMLADADRRFKAYLVEFGLTPAARSRVKADGNGGATVDPAERYFG